MSLADLVRLFALPIFGLIAYRDVKFRRVPDKVWYPLVGLGVLTLAYDLFQLRAVASGLQREILLQIGVAVGFLLILAAVFYTLELVDVTIARALAVVGIIYPLVPTDPLLGFDLPLVRPGHGLLSFTILSNAALIGLLYPVGYTLWNGLQGHFAPVMFVGRPVERTRVSDRHGRLLETSRGYLLQGPDLEAVKSYLRWREITVSLIAQRPDALRDPAYRPEPDAKIESHAPEFSADPADPWGAEQFLDEGTYVGNLTPTDLRAALDLIAEQEEIWVSANFPFAVPIFAGMILGVTVGDLATGIYQLAV